MAKISSPLTASRALLIAASAKPISTSFCTCCSSGCHNWRQIASYKCIHSIFFKKKITNKSTNTCDTNSKIPYRRWDLFNSEDSDKYASIWLLHWGSSFDHKPLWLFFSYKQNIWVFLKKKKKKQNKTKLLNDKCKKNSPLYDFVFSLLMGQGLKWCAWKE